MTDYLEEQLDSANALLEQVRKLERSAGALPQKEGENGENSGESAEKEGEFQEKSQGVSAIKGKADNLEEVVNHTLSTEDDPRNSAALPQTPPEALVNKTIGTVDDWEGRTGMPAAGAGEGQSPLPRPGTTDEGRAERPAPPLAARLEELDRAVSLLWAAPPAGLEGAGGRRQAAPSASPPAGPLSPGLNGAGRGENPGPGEVTSPLTASDKALDWAEQADRVFRRDSRRYDGGFYLY